MLRMETRRALSSRMFWLVLVLGVILSIPGLMRYNDGPKNIPGMPHMYNVYEAFLWAQKSLIIIFVPVLAVLPFADSYTLDRVSGYLRSILLRCSYARYLITKLIVNMVAGGLALAIPLGLVFVGSYFVFSAGLPPVHQARIHPTGPGSEIYWDYPALYIMFLIGLSFIVGAVYATVGLAISQWTSNRYVVLVTPFALYHVANFVLGVSGLAAWTPPMTFHPEGVTSSTWTTVFGELALILVVSLVTIALKSNKETATLDKELE